jgi:hypothetical protein
VKSCLDWDWPTQLCSTSDQIHPNSDHAGRHGAECGARMWRSVDCLSGKTGYSLAGDRQASCFRQHRLTVAKLSRGKISKGIIVVVKRQFHFGLDEIKNASEFST